MMPIVNFGSIHLPTFFLVISVSLSLLLVLLSMRVDSFRKDRKIAFDLAIITMLSGFIGGRLLHVFFEEWPYYSEHYYRIFEFWRGGFVYFGGMAGAFIACTAYLKWRKQDFFEWADFFAPLFSLSHALGRIGCLLTGCCFGTFCELPWEMEGRHPTAVYLMLGELIIFSILIYFERKKSAPKKGHLFVKWILLHSVLRLNVEYFRDDFRGAFFKLPLFGNLSVSQVVSLLLMLGVGVFYYLSYRKKKET
jgi:phosphatidylglycerol:prolipoprotein diacylglycerol transferase